MSCLLSQIEVSGQCQDCPNPSDQVPNADRISCMDCPAGQVPNSDKTLCDACDISQIEATPGQCQECPIGEAPNDDRISCFVEVSCPDDCTSPDQGDCDLKTGMCNCKNGFTCDNCAGELKLCIESLLINVIV